jgi:hypothetical protein
MQFGMLAHAPLLVWLGLAITLVFPFHLPRFGMVVGALGTLAGALWCSNASTDQFARVIAHQLGTATLVVSGLWLVTACAGAVRGGRVTAAAV